MCLSKVVEQISDKLMEQCNTTSICHTMLSICSKRRKRKKCAHKKLEVISGTNGGQIKIGQEKLFERGSPTTVLLTRSHQGIVKGTKH